MFLKKGAMKKKGGVDTPFGTMARSMIGWREKNRYKCCCLCKVDICTNKILVAYFYEIPGSVVKFKKFIDIFAGKAQIEGSRGKLFSGVYFTV